MKADINKYQSVFEIENRERNASLRENLTLKYAPFVKYIADRMSFKLPPTISKEELISAGAVGLLDAIDKFDSTVGIKFETYAEYRIKGAILDELRKMDWVSRSIRKEIHNIENATMALKSKLKREPEDDEIAQELGVDIDAYYKMVNRAWGVRLLSLDELMPDGSVPKFAKQPSESQSPFNELKIKELKKVIAKTLSGLTKKEQIVISLYYYEELTLKEISKVLDLTESRISQIHSKALIRLRKKLKSYYES